MLVSQFRGSQSAVAQLAWRADDLGAPHLPLNGMLCSSPTNRAYRLIGYRQLPDKMEKATSGVRKGLATWHVEGLDDESTVQLTFA